jgi:hypothetical protein
VVHAIPASKKQINWFVGDWCNTCILQEKYVSTMNKENNLEGEIEGNNSRIRKKKKRRIRKPFKIRKRNFKRRK